MAAILIDAVLLLVLLAVTVYWVRALFPGSAVELRYRQLWRRRRVAQEPEAAAPHTPNVEGDPAGQLPAPTP